MATKVSELSSEKLVELFGLTIRRGQRRAEGDGAGGRPALGGVRARPRPAGSADPAGVLLRHARSRAAPCRRGRARAAGPGRTGDDGREASAGRARRAAGRAPQLGEPQRRGRRDARRLRLLGLDEGEASTRRCGRVRGKRPLRKLFSKEQRAFFAEHAPDGSKLDDLRCSGRRSSSSSSPLPEALGRQAGDGAVAAPRRLPDPRALDEVRPGGGVPGRRRGAGVPEGSGSISRREQQTKTKTTLELFAAEL